MDKEKSDEHMVSLEKLSTRETVCLLINQNAKAKQYVNVGLDVEEYQKAKAKK